MAAGGGQLVRKTSVPNVQGLQGALSGDFHLHEVQSLPDVRTIIGPGLAFNRPHGIRRKISVLMLSPRWYFDSYGIASISKSLINDLRFMDPNGESVNISCAVLKEEGKIPPDQLRNSEQWGVKLIGARQPRGKIREPQLQWLDEDVNKYYQDLIVNEKFDFIIGHIPYVANGALNLKSFCDKQKHDTKVILVVHALPKTDDGEIDEDRLADWLREADLVLSIGGNVWMQIALFLEAMDIHADHELYLPSVHQDLPNLKQSEAEPKLSGEQNIVILVPDGENPENSGLDFELAVVSSAQASQNIMNHEGYNLSRQLSFNLKVIATTEEEKESLEGNFKAIKEKHKIEGSTPNFKFCSPRKPEKLRPHMKRATLIVLPLKNDNPVFGTETLNAMAAGIPILVSKNSGIALFLQERGLCESVVWDCKGFEENVGLWKEKLVQKITNPDEALRLAQELRELLHLDLQTECTHRNFIKYVTGKLSDETTEDYMGTCHLRPPSITNTFHS